GRGRIAKMPARTGRGRGIAVGGTTDRTARLPRDRTVAGARRPGTPGPRGGPDHRGGDPLEERADVVAAGPVFLLRRRPDRRLRRLLPRILLRRKGPELPADAEVPHPRPRGADQGLFPPARVQDPDPWAVRGGLPDRRVPDGRDPQAAGVPAPP